MFLLYINDIQDAVQYSTTRLFADDCLLYRVIQTEEDADKLQSDLERLQRWSEIWQMNFNPKKCYLLIMQRKRQPVTRDYTLSGDVLAPVSHHPYLGVILQTDGKWTNQIDKCVKKASQCLGFIRRNLGRCPAEVKAQGYITLARPHLEYASSRRTTSGKDSTTSCQVRVKKQ